MEEIERYEVGGERKVIRKKRDLECEKGIFATTK